LKVTRILCGSRLNDCRLKAGRVELRLKVA